MASSVRAEVKPSLCEPSLASYSCREGYVTNKKRKEKKRDETVAYLLAQRDVLVDDVFDQLRRHCRREALGGTYLLGLGLGLGLGLQSA
jgi:hypothetical protein